MPRKSSALKTYSRRGDEITLTPVNMEGHQAADVPRQLCAGTGRDDRYNKKVILL
jgi:hypothetical protein